MSTLPSNYHIFSLTKFGFRVIIHSSNKLIVFHLGEVRPDYSYVNADYELVNRDFNLVKNEVIRFAGKESFAYNIVPHWAPISKEGVLVLRDTRQWYENYVFHLRRKNLYHRQSFKRNRLHFYFCG